jgi:hypothetical protein
MQNAALNGFQPVFDCRHRTFKNYVRCIIQKPIPVLAVKTGVLFWTSIAYFLPSLIN